MPQRFQTGRHFDYGPTKSNSCQGRMVKQSLRKLIQAATSLEAQLQDNDDLPQWVHYKVATAEDRLVMAAQYMLYEIQRRAPTSKEKP
jgi:hypothetical protein